MVCDICSGMTEFKNKIRDWKPTISTKLAGYRGNLYTTVTYIVGLSVYTQLYEVQVNRRRTSPNFIQIYSHPPGMPEEFYTF